jgi:aminomethyltransferase
MSMGQSDGELKTPLYDIHVSGGGKIVPFAGYLLPIQYEGVIAEHNAVRTAAGIFDVSHMGEILYEGQDALRNLQYAMSNDFSKMKDGDVKYSLILNEEGGIKDDVLVYKYCPEKFLVVVNAANRRKDFEWLASLASGAVSVKDLSDDFAQIALQGPKSREILLTLASASDIPEKYYTFIDSAVVSGVECMVSRTGYTGELGYEIYARPEDAPALWQAMLEAGRDFGLLPAGLGARDTLRLEAGMPLYGHEMDEGVTPFEAGLGFGVKISKEDFIGKAALKRRGEPKRVRVGMKITGRGIVRENETVRIGDEIIGSTTSGTHAPYLKYPIAMASVDSSRSGPGTKTVCDVRGKAIEAEIVPLPFYSAKK